MESFKYKIGERADVSLGKGQAYRTKLEDITEEGYLVISQPIYRGIPVIMHVDQELEIFLYRKNGRFSVKAKVVGIEVSEALRLILLEALHEPARLQRREAFRLPVRLKAVVQPEGGDEDEFEDADDDFDAPEAEVRGFDDGPFASEADGGKPSDTERTVTFDLSETGVALRTVHERTVGEKLRIRVWLNWPKENSPPIEYIGEIVQVNKDARDAEYYRIGVKFLDYTKAQRSMMSKFILQQQQEKIRRQRFVERDG